MFSGNNDYNWFSAACEYSTRNPDYANPYARYTLGTYTSTVSIREADKANAILRIPQDAAGKELHIICEVTDNGTPALTSYRRVIIRPKR